MGYRNSTDFSNWGGTVDLSNLSGSDLHFFDMQGRTVWQSVNSVKTIEEAYQKYSPLAAVTMKLSEMFANGCFEVVNKTTQNYTRGAYKEWDELFARPNYLQTRTEFLKQLYTYVLLNGWCYALPLYPAGGFSDKPSAIWILPPSCIRVEPVKRRPFDLTKRDKLRRVFFVWKGTEQELDERELVLFKDSAAVMYDPDTWLPISRVASLKYPISNGIGAMESRNSLIYDRGASGILANTASDVHGEIPVEEDEIKRLQDHYSKRYGLTKGKTMGNIIITHAALKWQPMTMNVKDLMLHEEHESSIKDICDSLGYNYRLLSTGEGATYANAERDEKRIYTGTIIPQAASLIETLNYGLKLNDKNIEVLLSYEHLEVLKQSMVDEGKGLLTMNSALEKMWNNNLITWNQWLKKLGWDIVGSEKDSDNMYNKFKNQLTAEERGILEEANQANAAKQPKN